MFSVLSKEELQKILRYYPEDGSFIRLRDSKNAKSGSAAGRMTELGYIVISIHGKRYFAHRLAWLYVHGVWPSMALDHINGIAHDNRIMNLREATTSENAQNRKMSIRNTSGFVGVSWHKKSSKWIATIEKDGHPKYLGCFDDPELAYAAYCDAKKSMHPFQPTVPVRAMRITS